MNLIPSPRSRLRGRVGRTKFEVKEGRRPAWIGAQRPE
jgi:hypothetical protein